MKGIVGALVTITLVLAVAGVAWAPYHQTGPYPSPQAQTPALKTQLRTAITHANNSANSEALNGAVTHLGHVLNCIEGTRGKNFNQSWGHVCEGQGNGILTDLRAASGGATFMLVAQTADDLSVAGVKSRELAAVRNAARGVAALLTVIDEGMK